MSEDEVMRALADAHGCGVATNLQQTCNIVAKNATTTYPQDEEQNEYRYIDAAWLDEIAKGLTAGAVKHPGETWRTIPAEEHAARAMRHINMWLMGDRSEPHLVNASMRVMMAFATQRED